MRIPSAEQLVSAWEAGVGLPPTGRALELLAAGEPETPRRVLASLTIGQRDRRLLHLRAAIFGPTLDATVVCTACATRVEFAMELARLLVTEQDVPARTAVDVDGVAWELRLPTSDDLLRIADAPLDAAALALLERCITPPDASPTHPSSASLTGAVRGFLAAKMAELDPQADIQLSVSCPACGHAWLSEFDVVSYFWAELTWWVRRLLLDVHRLASAYGWGQAEIIAMSRQRRAAYLELIGA